MPLTKEDNVDSHISHIINRALDGALITRDEVVDLLSVEHGTIEAAAIQIAGRRLTEELCDGEAEIHGHIGLDATPCPNDCKFCSFAASARIFRGRNEFTTEEVVANARDFAQAGINAIYLVTTETYDKEKFLEMGAAVKREIGDISLVANVPDFDYDYAVELKKTGFTGCYHVIRFGEGVYTRCSVENRHKTMRAAKEAGLALGNCIDPIGPEHTPDEIADLVMIAREYEVAFSGAMRRNTIPNSVFSEYGNIPYTRLADYVGAVALATGTGIPGNCTHEPSPLTVQGGANIIWAERGSSPRDVSMENTRGLDVGQCRDIYKETEWPVHEGPSRFYS